MASRLKYSIALVAGCAATALALRAWRPPQPQGAYGIYWDSVAAERDSLLEIAARSKLLHREYMLADSLLPRLARTPDSVVIEAPVEYASFLPQMRAIAHAEIADGPVKSRVGVFLYDEHYAQLSANHSAPTNIPTIFTGSDAAGPYCMLAAYVTVPARFEGSQFDLRYVNPGSNRYRANLLGPCLYWTHYGSPGAGVEEWLRQGGYHYTMAPATLLDSVVPIKRTLFGIRDASLPGPSAYACIAGDTSQCVATLRAHDNLRTTLAAYDPRDEYTVWSWYRRDTFGNDETAMMAQIERQFGSQKFATFWTSDQPVDVAFASAFGVPLGEWTRDWARHWFGTAATPGPRIDAMSWLISLAVIAIMLGIAYGIADRRQVR